VGAGASSSPVEAHFPQCWGSAYTEHVFQLQSLKGLVLPVSPRLSTGVAALDDALGGGLPLGKVVEVSGPPGSGRSTLALSIGLRCLALGQAIAWIESRSSFWPLPAIEAGVSLDRLLVLRVSPAERLRAAHLLLSSSGAVQMAIVDLSGAPGKRRQDPDEMTSLQLARLHRFTERSSTLLLFLTERSPDASSLGPLVDIRLHLSLPARVPAEGFPLPPAGDRASRDSIFDRRFEVAVLRHKQGPSQGHFSESLHGPDRLRLRSTL
jgi:hypothetical protein